MADIFISYGRSTEPQAQLVAESLRASGYSVWRDDELPAHRAYGDVIEERLRGAKAVVVLWSAEAAHSQWVRAEADIAGKPAPWSRSRSTGFCHRFRSTRSSAPISTAGRGDTSAPGWRKVESSVALLVGAPAGAGTVTERKGAPGTEDGNLRAALHQS